MKHCRTIGCLLGTTILLLGASNAAWAVDYSGTLNFGNYPTTVPLKFGNVTVPVDVGIDLDRFDLGTGLSGPVNISFTTHNAFNTTGTILAVLFATDPNNAIVSNPTSLGGLIDPNATISSILDAHVTGWTFAAWDTSIVPNGTANIAALFNPPIQFTAGTHYYAFVTGGTTREGTVLTDPSVGYTLDVGAVPEPGEYAMMMAGLGLIGLMRRRRKEAAAV